MAKKSTPQTEQAAELVSPPEAPVEREVKTRRQETRPNNVVFSEKAGNRLRLLTYQFDALVQQCRGRVARPSKEQFEWLSEWLRGKTEATLTAISVELAKTEANVSSTERPNVAVPI